MSTALTSPLYPFDPTGTKSSNLVTGELQPLTGMGDRDYYTIIPAAAPFYADTFTCSVKTLDGTIVPLNEGVDFYFTHYFMGATRATAKPVYGSITLLNTQLRGTLILNPYQCVGGDWMVDSNKIAEILAMQSVNPRSISWDQVAGYPTIFPPVPHEWNLMDMVGQSEILAAMDRIVDAILTQASSAMNDHINNMSGQAHGITPGSIGAVSMAQLQAAVKNAVDSAASSTDKVAEGATNKYFTEARVLATKLANYAIAAAVDNLSEQDTVLQAFSKLQANLTDVRAILAKKADANRPQFSGLGSQNLYRYAMTGTFAMDISLSEAFQITIKGNGSIGFNTARVGDMTDRLVEFSVTTINDGTNNAYAIAWPTNVKWVDGVAPPRSTTPNAKDEWYFWSEDNMATWTGSLSNKNAT